MPSTVWVKKSTLIETQIREDTSPPLGDGEVRLRIESFSVTANNITYAVIGDMFGYWNFFPAQGNYGVVPMWGHAVVEESRHLDIAAGERVYGYLPMGTHLDVLPGKVSGGGFTDMAAHRQPMSPIYNQYSRLNADPEHDPAKEAERMLFGPLFKTGFLIEAMFRREAWFEAEVLVMTSASSKTSMGLASVAKDLSPALMRIGLTSAGNVAFVEDTGLYDKVLAYDDVGSLPQLPSVSVDFAGNSGLLRSIHETLGDGLKYSCLVGATHVDARGLGGGGGEIPGPKPILFFAPDHAVATVQELGPKGFGEAVAVSWKQFLGAVDGVVTIDERQGLHAAANAFVETLQGNADPQKGIIIRP
ncbi:DUF2855 family protein [Sphingorhabdus sp.]|uniref:DUF2855 family protein n=1 Tax=Sphingorhabdus sp. TaxID=1902408 RepID=UPI003592FB37